MDEIVSEQFVSTTARNGEGGEMIDTAASRVMFVLAYLLLGTAGGYSFFPFIQI